MFWSKLVNLSQNSINSTDVIYGDICLVPSCNRWWFQYLRLQHILLCHCSHCLKSVFLCFIWISWAAVSACYFLVHTSWTWRWVYSTFLLNCLSCCHVSFHLLSTGQNHTSQAPNHSYSVFLKSLSILILWQSSLYKREGSSTQRKLGNPTAF